MRLLSTAFGNPGGGRGSPAAPYEDFSKPEKLYAKLQKQHPGRLILSARAAGSNRVTYYGATETELALQFPELTPDGDKIVLPTAFDRDAFKRFVEQNPALAELLKQSEGGRRALAGQPELVRLRLADETTGRVDAETLPQPELVGFERRQAALIQFMKPDSSLYPACDQAVRPLLEVPTGDYTVLAKLDVGNFDEVAVAYRSEGKLQYKSEAHVPDDLTEAPAYPEESVSFVGLQEKQIVITAPVALVKGQCLAPSAESFRKAIEIGVAKANAQLEDQIEALKQRINKTKDPAKP